MINFLLIFAALLVIGYPIHGTCMYGDPWTWIFKEPQA